MSFRRMLPFLLLNVLVSAAVMLAILWWWDGRTSELEPVAAVLQETSPQETLPLDTGNVPLEEVSAVEEPGSQTSAEPGPETHIVQAGDTLWDLAMRHKVGVRSLAKWNGMAPRDTLSVGQKIVIWSRNTDAKSAYDPSHISAPPRRNVTQRIGYRVRRGDSLARIANKFRVSVNQLLRWNKKVKKSNYLQPGQRIVLYVDVTRTSS